MMKAFGVRFSFEDRQLFQHLSALYAEIKADKDADKFRDPQNWVLLVPDAIKPNFNWPTEQERLKWLEVRGSKIIAISSPSRQIGRQWNFFRVFEAIEEGDYEVLGCHMVGDGTAELQINPDGYPYGGVGPLIALVEAFGFEVLGVNEYGRYQSRDDLLGGTRQT